jgi:Biopterin-dependent aromatic amino acid hydroxylase
LKHIVSVNFRTDRCSTNNDNPEQIAIALSLVPNLHRLLSTSTVAIFPKRPKTLTMSIVRTMLSGRVFRPSIARIARSSLPSAMTTTSISFFSTNLNEDNMSDIHEHHPQPPQEWTTFHGKIPVLKTESVDHSYDNSSATTSHHRPMPHAATPVENFYGERPRVSLLMELKDKVGILHEVLKYFWKYDLNVSRIESRPVQRQKNPWSHDKDDQAVFDFYLDFDGTLNDPAAKKLLRDLAPLTEKLLILDEKDVHWFPRHVSELDLIAHRTLDAGVDLESDHPGFNDEAYRARRGELARNAIQHRWDQPIPRIEYTKEETETWSAVWDRMEPLWKQYACKEYLVRISSPCIAPPLFNHSDHVLSFVFSLQ